MITQGSKNTSPFFIKFVWFLMASFQLRLDDSFIWIDIKICFNDNWTDIDSQWLFLFLLYEIFFQSYGKPSLDLVFPNNISYLYFLYFLF